MFWSFRCAKQLEEGRWVSPYIVFCGANIYSLNELKRECVVDFLDYLEQCHPNLSRVVRNLSYILPSLMEAGLPTAGPQLNSLLLTEPEDYDDDAFNRLCRLPANFDTKSLQLSSIFLEIPASSSIFTMCERKEPGIAMS